MRITGIIRTRHHTPGHIAAAIAADNLQDMETEAVETEGIVRTTISGTRIRSVIASVDDYLANISVAEDVCRELRPEDGQGVDKENSDMIPTTLE